MLDEFRGGENVQNCRLAIWLTEDEYESFERGRESLQQLREELKDKPHELKRYENTLHQASFDAEKLDVFAI